MRRGNEIIMRQKSKCTRKFPSINVLRDCFALQQESGESKVKKSQRWVPPPALHPSIQAMSIDVWSHRWMYGMYWNKCATARRVWITMSLRTKPVDECCALLVCAHWLKWINTSRERERDGGRSRGRRRLTNTNWKNKNKLRRISETRQGKMNVFLFRIYYFIVYHCCSISYDRIDFWKV